jgi:UDP-N-acetylmuramate-alanine ligase
VDNLSADGLGFDVLHGDRRVASVRWRLGGLHNAHNALAAMLAARHVGVPIEVSVAALSEFKGVKRRLELRGEAGGVQVFDDFAHHPTAIEVTIAALRRQIGDARILAVVEPRSNTMKLGVHKHALARSLEGADLSFLLQPANAGWDVAEAVASLGERAAVATEVDALVERIATAARPGDRVLVMSNGAFGGIHGKLLRALEQERG